jgi:hypothetical protein
VTGFRWDLDIIGMRNYAIFILKDFVIAVKEKRQKKTFKKRILKVA